MSIKSNKIDVAYGGFYEIAMPSFAVNVSHCIRVSVLLVVNGLTCSTHEMSYSDEVDGAYTPEFTDEIYIPSGAFVEIKLVSKRGTSGYDTCIYSSTGSFTIKRI